MDGMKQQEPQKQLQFVTGQHYKVHKSYIWLMPMIAAVIIFFTILSNGIGGIVELVDAAGELQPFQLGLIAGVVVIFLLLSYGIAVGVSALLYKNLSFVFGEREFSVYSGVITKKHVHVPYGRIQSVNHRATIIQRIAGVCTVTIDTAGGAANKAIRVPYVTLDEANRMRSELYIRKSGVTVPEGAAVISSSRQDAPPVPGSQGYGEPHKASDASYNPFDEAVSPMSNWSGVFSDGSGWMEPVTFELGLSGRELLLTSLSHGSAITTAVVCAVIASTFPVYGMLGEYWFVGAVLAALLIGSTVLGYGIGVLSLALAYGNFHARRRGSRIEVERGVLQRELSGMDIDRIQSLTVRQSLVRRLMGYCEISLGRIDARDEGGDNKNNNLNRRGLVIHPFVRLDRVDDVIAGLIPEFADMPRTTDMHRLPPVALRRGIIRRGIVRNPFFYLALAWTAMAVLAGMNGVSFDGVLPAEAVGNLFSMTNVIVYGMFLASVVLMTTSSVLWKRGSGFALRKRYLMIFNDGLRTDFTVVPKNKVQSCFTRTNPFQRFSGVASIVGVTAAGIGQTGILLWDVSKDDGDRLLDWLS